eukprot:TRINITY_DN17891_c0_g1_i1.p1 TRINITY_DN17891_c0_g1~~TRINITY_DN17891_c0_g1_i1.p1  ORF type:complete len:250 (+),score=40.01 TRINITY_DN17891_c0_g1_i1:269-1018(+)
MQGVRVGAVHAFVDGEVRVFLAGVAIAVRAQHHHGQRVDRDAWRERHALPSSLPANLRHRITVGYACLSAAFDQGGWRVTTRVLIGNLPCNECALWLWVFFTTATAAAATANAAAATRDSSCNLNPANIVTASVHLIEAYDLLKQQDFTRAEQKLTLAITSNPYHEIFFCIRARVRIGLKKYLSSAQDSATAITLYPKYCAAYANLGVALLHQGRLKDALEFGFLWAYEISPSQMLLDCIYDTYSKYVA